MIKLENTEVLGWEAAIRGMRNPMNSWDKSDSLFNFDAYYKSAAARDCGLDTMIANDILGENYDDPDTSRLLNLHDEFIQILGTQNVYFQPPASTKLKYPCIIYKIASRDDLINPGSELPISMAIGPNDHKLMMNLARAGSVDAKYRRMIVVTVDITAPLYWWKEFDTYKVGTVANSCSTMHKIHAKEFTLDDFSCEHLGEPSLQNLKNTIKCMNDYREWFLKDHDKYNWWQMIQLLPTSYNQRRTVMLNYEVLAGIYPKRKDHKLDEWHDFCDWIKSLPYSEIITLEEYN